MNPGEAKDLVKMLAGLFPSQLTQEQARFAAKELAPFTVEAATRAIREHRRSHEFIAYPKLLEGCRVAENHGKLDARLAQHEQSWCDIQRRLCPQLAKAGDVEVILRVHRKWAVQAAGGDHFDQMTDGYRKQIETSCRSQLMAIAYNPGQNPSPKQLSETSVWIDETAELVFASVETFKQVLADLRGELAIASAAASSPF